jgi:hypothetical protein
MIECPFCYRVFRQPPEKLGARCPKCRMPFYEDPAKRRKAPEKDHGPCRQHPESASIANCSRCNAPVCQTCRTRWHEEAVCPQCVDNSLADDEPSPMEAQMQTKHAWFGVIFGIVAWALLLFTIPMVIQFHNGTVKPIFLTGTYCLFLGSMIPAVFGLGFAVSAVRLRGDFSKLAASGLICAGGQLGLILGIIVINLWHN